MFDNLTSRLTGTLRKLTGKAVLTEANIKGAMGEVKRALLDADVALPVVNDFTARVRARAVGQEVTQSLTPGQAFIKIVQTELVTLMGAANEQLNLKVEPPAVVLVAGLQGAGKTTTVAKLAHWLKTSAKKSVMVTSADVYRPAAIQQLQTLAAEIGVPYLAAPAEPNSPAAEQTASQLPPTPGQAATSPVTIATTALQEAKRRFADVLLVDSAGRLAIDQPMMDEIRLLHATLQPIETLFVVDAMTGQDAATTASAFDAALPLTGVVLTKADGDARGGAALSVRHITGKPIKFIGMGEKVDALEAFHPDRIASRILGMGDVMSLIEQAEQKVDKKQADQLAQKLKQGRGFDLEDFRQQLKQMQNMGGVTSMMEKLPGMGAMGAMGAKGGLPAGAAQQVDEKNVTRMEAIINSMTPKERQRPDILNGSRKRRITRGSGTTIQDLNRLLKQHKVMQQMMKKAKGGGVKNIMRGLGGRSGQAASGFGGIPGLPATHSPKRGRGRRRFR